MGIFSRRKLAIRKGCKYQYGKTPILQSTFKKQQKLLRSNGPTNFHTIPGKKFRLGNLFLFIPKKVKKIAILLSVVGLIAFLTYLIVFSSYFLVTTIKVNPNKEIIPELGTKIQEDLKSYKGKNIIFLHKSEIVDKIQNAYPEIEDIDVSTDWPDTVIISFSEYPAVANITNIATNGGNKKYIVSTIGYVVKEDQANPNLPYIKIKTDEPMNTAGAIIDPDKLKYIIDAMNYFKEKFGMKILEAEYKVIPREVYLKTEKFFDIWLDIQKPSEDQFKKLKKALVKLDIFKEPLEYIDLRITGENGEKIIYKRRK